jgi:hypothetical protein
MAVLHTGAISWVNKNVNFSTHLFECSFSTCDLSLRTFLDDVIIILG